MKGSVFPHAAAGLSICGNASDHSAMQGAARPNPKILPLPLSAPEASAPPRAAKHTPNPHSVPKTQVSSTGKGAETALNHRGTRSLRAQWSREPHSALANRSSSGPRPPTGKERGAGLCRLPARRGPYGRGWQRIRKAPLTIILEAASGAQTSPVPGLGTAHPSPQCSAPEASSEPSG